MDLCWQAIWNSDGGGGEWLWCVVQRERGDEMKVKKMGGVIGEF